MIIGLEVVSFTVLGKNLGPPLTYFLEQYQEVTISD